MASVVVVSFDRTAGEAIAASLSRRGCSARFLLPEDLRDDLVETVVLDLSAGDRARSTALAELVGDRATRLIQLGDDPRGHLAQLSVHARVATTASLDELLEAIVGDGRPGSRQEGRHSARSRPGRVVLTNRERQLLRELLAGNTTAQVAARWSVSEHTVRTHRQKLLQKIGARSQSEAAAWALRVGLTPASAAQEVGA